MEELKQLIISLNECAQRQLDFGKYRSLFIGIGVLTTALAVLIFTLPLCAFVLLCTIVGLLSYIYSQLRKELFVHNEIMSQTIQTIGRSIDDVYDKLNEKDAYITELHARIKDLSTEPSPAPHSQEAADEILKGHFKALLQVIQKLDITTYDFGEECHRYVRQQLERAVRKCRLHFVDYSEENSDCYDVENISDILVIDYTERAIVSNEDNQVVLKGHVYLPMV